MGKRDFQDAGKQEPFPGQLTLLQFGRGFADAELGSSQARLGTPYKERYVCPTCDTTWDPRLVTS